MKKLLGLLIGLLLFIPIVSADMGTPIIEEYQAQIINKNGADIYEYDSGKYTKTGKSLKYKDVVTIDYEEWDDNTTYCYIKGSGLVKCSDITAVNSDYVTSEYSDKEFVDSYVFNDVEIKKGPAFGYNTIGIIKAGTYIKIKIIDESSTWCYVEYKGLKGFIYSYGGSNYTLGRVDTALMSWKDIDIEDVKTGNKVGQIKANTMLTKGVYYLDGWARKYYVDYNGVKGFISMDFGVNEGYSVKLLKKANVYRSVGLRDEVVTTLDEGTIFDTAFIDIEMQSTYIYYKNGDIEGWIVDDVDDEGYYHGHELVKKIDNKIPLEENEITNNEDQENTNTNNNLNNKPVRKDTLIITIMGSVIVFLTALVIILLINKKKVK